MKKILFLGNSHVGALRAGRNLIKKEKMSSYELSFWGIPRDGVLDDIDTEKLHLLLKNPFSNFLAKNYPLDSYNLNTYDYVIWIQNFSPLDPRCFYPLIHLKQLKNFVFKYNALSDNLIQTVIESEAYLKISSTRKDKRFTSERELSKIYTLRKNLGDKFLFLGMPYIFFNTNRISASDSNAYLKEVDKIFSDQQLKIKSIFEKWNESNELKFIFPPKKIFSINNFYAKDIYNRGSLNAAGANLNEKNRIHMNGDYGKEIILSLINDIKLKT